MPAESPLIHEPGPPSSSRRLALAVVFALAVGVALAQVRPGRELEVARVGAGSYALRPPVGAAGPPRPVRVSKAITARVPTNRFWSSLVAGERPLPQYPHPLAVQPTRRGPRVQCAGPSLAIDAVGVHGGLSEADGAEDLVLGHARAPDLPALTLEEFGDWTLRVRMSDGGAARLDVTYGHGSPYVFAALEGGGARVTFPEPPTRWAGDDASATLGVTIRGRHYGLFGPRGSSWSRAEARSWTNEAAAHLSVAVLPAATTEVLSLFERHAHAHVTGSRAAWRYDPATSRVETTFTVDTRAREGEERDTLLALYPHQWAHTEAALLPGLEYRTVRGPMRLVRGRGFATRLTYPGLLPALPPVVAPDAARRRALVEDELVRAKSPPLDAYWEGKLLGRLAAQVPLAEEAGGDQARRLLEALARRLERRFTALGADSRPKDTDRFEHEPAWGTLIARPAAFGSETTLNDHHLHYGYYLRAAAEVARLDPAWAQDERWGGMVRLLVRDIASTDRADPLFPYLRCFDVYAGHSWASGLTSAPAGSDLESSSESLHAWTALVLLGQALGDEALRDLGVFLYTTELSAVEEYWFDVAGRSFPPELEPPALAMIWGGKGVLETWFSTEPEALFGINWLPLHGGSLYLGRYPEVAARVYDEVRRRRGSEAWALWPDLVIMYRALSDPDDAARQLAALGPDAFPEPGNSRLNLERWVGALQALGRVDRTTTADCPLYAVFARPDGGKVHVAYRMPRDPPFVATFSDGVRVACDAPGFTWTP